METMFGNLPTNSAFTVNDTWLRDELEIGKVYFKVNDREARLAVGGPGSYRASTMPRIQFAESHPVQQAV